MDFMYKGHKLLKKHIRQQCASGKIAINVIVNERGIGINETTRLKQLYYHLQENAERVNLSGRIEFTLVDVKAYDLSFIGIICLFRSMFKKVVIDINISTADSYDNERVFYQLAHLMSSSADSKGNTLFTIIKNDRRIRVTARNAETFMTNATTYLPLLRIDETSYQAQFVETYQAQWEDLFLNAINIRQLCADFEASYSENRSVNDQIFVLIKKALVRVAQENIARNHFNMTLYVTALYFIMLLQKLRLVRLLLKPYIEQLESRKLKEYVIGKHTLGISNFGLEEDRKYEKFISDITIHLLKSPSYYIMLSSIIITNTFKVGGAESKRGIEELKNGLENTLHFTLQLYDGIKELAKNIVEHSSNKQGIITARIFDKGRLRLLKSKEDFDYIDRHESFLDIQVIDDSKEGIISTTVKNLDRLKTVFVEEASLFEKEKSDILAGKFRLQDFYIKPRVGLLHQNIRASASLGLLILGDVLFRNNGLMKVCTLVEGKSLGVAITNNKAYASTHLMPLGTCYNILLPLNIERSLTPRATSEPFEMISSTDAYEHLIDRVVLDNATQGCPNQKGSTKKCVIWVHFKSHQEHQNLVREECIATRCKKVKNQILVIDFKDHDQEIDVSTLFRMLSDVQVKYGRRSIIITNLESVTVKRLISILNIYSKLGLSIWSNTNFVLCYYLERENNLSSREYFAFVLGGEKWEDLAWVNNHISKNHLTQKSILTGERLITDITPSEEFSAALRKNPLFTSSGQLIPFDTLICCDGRTLFEWNTLSAMHRLI